jgi:hypothetical protein
VTTRNDIEIEYNTSPRVAEVAEPSVEVTMQDLVDTIRKQEDSFQGMSFKKLINASGKEDLGGGVRVGITVAMQNLLLAFAGRTVPAETGTVTGSPASPVVGKQILQDTNATFIANNVQRGSLVVNFTDESIAEVVSVDSQEQLTTKTLTEGIGNTYDVNDSYKVWNIVQVTATGGNLTAVDEFQSVINAILPTAFTQVVLTASSSATLQEQADIEYSSFGGGVTYDATSIYSGTLFPVGTPRQPCNDLADVISIAAERGFRKIFVRGDAVIDAGLTYNGLTFVGESTSRSVLTITAAANVFDCQYEDATVTGTLDGASTIKNCELGTLDFVNGIVESCLLTLGNITLGGTSDAQFIRCSSGVAGLDTPTIDMGGSGQSLVIRDYNGGIKITNKTGTDKVSIDMNSGQIKIDNTVTNGDVVLRGIATWSNRNTYTGGANIVNQLIDGALVQQIEYMSFDNKVTVDTVNGSAGTDYPQGVESDPVDNIADAVVIAVRNNLNTLRIKGDITLSSGTLPYIFIGDGENKSTITVDAGADVTGAHFEDCTLEGTLDTNISCERCFLAKSSPMYGLTGSIRDSIIGPGPIQLQGSFTTNVTLTNCTTSGGGPQTPVIDCNGDGPTLVVNGFTGQLIVKNKTGTAAAAIITLSAGDVTFDSTVTAGSLVVLGHGSIIDNSTGTATLVNQTVTALVWEENLAAYGADTAADTLKKAKINAANAFAVSS